VGRSSTRAVTKHAGRFQFENNYFTEMCSGCEAGSYSRLIDFVYHSTLGLREIKKKKKELDEGGHQTRGARGSSAL